LFATTLNIPHFGRQISLLKPRIRWVQFSLGTLFVGITVFSVWLAWQVELARRQKDAINELHKMHVAVLYRDPGSGRSESPDFRLRKALARAGVSRTGRIRWLAA
jgi:hypothetical protein